MGFGEWGVGRQAGRLSYLECEGALFGDDGLGARPTMAAVPLGDVVVGFVVG